MIPRRSGENVFWGCTGYPECKTALPDDGGKPATAHQCPECNAILRQLTAKKGKNKGKKFWACSEKACNFTAQDEKGAPKQA